MGGYLHRAVRAAGFSGAAFEAVAGCGCYRWMPDLGNAAVRAGGRKVAIKDPSAAATLLEIAADCHQRRQRVIFFCACEVPRECHRFVVGQYLLACAQARRQALTVTEWPGRKPTTFTCSAPANVIAAVCAGRAVPLATLHPAPPRTLAWGSIIRLAADNGEGVAMIAGSPQLRRDWRIPVIACYPADTPAAKVQAAARAARRKRGVEPRTATRRTPRRATRACPAGEQASGGSRTRLSN